MRLRVCILVRENVLHWAPLYVEAFRQRCDVITVGPALDRDRLRALHWTPAEQFLVPNDIVSDLDDVPALMESLPGGWRPDVVVGIQSCAPAYRNVAALACPTAYISVDTWHAPEEYVFARGYDVVFAAQKSFPPYFRQAGIRHAYWLPLAAAPEHHRPFAVEKDYDIVFVGALMYVVNEQRRERLARLGAEFRVARQEGVGSLEMSQAFCRGRLAFNSSIAQDVNMRVFEVLAMGCPLLTNRDAAANGLLDFFEDGKHLITYDDNDLIERARAYLADDAAREAIGRAGRAEVLAKHTYRHRVDTLLETIRGAVPTLGNREDSLLRQGELLSAYLPHGAETVVDVGLELDRSKVALRRRGIRRVIGVGIEYCDLERRAGSYDALTSWSVFQAMMSGAAAPDRKAEQIDTLLWTSPGRYGMPFAQLLALAHTALCEGGTLVLRLQSADFAAAGLPADPEIWDRWLYENRFHLVRFYTPRSGETWHVLVMRKYLRTVSDISAEVYRRFPAAQSPPENTVSGNNAPISGPTPG